METTTCHETRPRLIVKAMPNIAHHHAFDLATAIIRLSQAEISNSAWGIKHYTVDVEARLRQVAADLGYDITPRAKA